MNGLLILSIVQVVFENDERARVFSQARAKAQEMRKPLLNAGCGALKPIGGFPRAILESDVNLDVTPQDVPRFALGSIEDIPYPDKYFGAVFCCHALEHIEDLDAGLRELHRVGDYLYVIVPRAIWPNSWLLPAHRRVFAGDRVYEKTERGWRIGHHRT